MTNSVELSLEQKFELQRFRGLVGQMSLEQAQDMLINLREQMLVQDALYKSIIKESWGIGECPTIKQS